MNEKIKKFIEHEILTSSITGGFFRGHRVYGKDIPVLKREPLKKHLRIVLKERFGNNLTNVLNQVKHIEVKHIEK